VRISDPYAASYGVADPIWALTQLAQTTMRSELGKYSLDRTFSERDALNGAIVSTINAAAAAWGIECLRYEIRDISPPASLAAAMALQAEAERRKRADILESEGRREAAINTAEGGRRSTVLAAQGDAEATLARAHASAAAIEMLATATGKRGAARAVALRVAEQYVAAFGALAKKGTTLVLPADAGNVGGMVATALGVYGAVAERARAAGGAGAAADDDADAGGDAAAGDAAPAPPAPGTTDRLYQEALRAVRGTAGAPAGFDLDVDGSGGARAAARRGGGGGGSGATFEPQAFGGISSTEAAARVEGRERGRE